MCRLSLSLSLRERLRCFFREWEVSNLLNKFRSGVQPKLVRANSAWLGPSLLSKSGLDRPRYVAG